MPKQHFDRKLEAIEALREAAEETAVAGLARALKDRSNYAVGKAAALANERGLHALLPDLLEAFERFFRDAAKADPQCWAKNAIAKALRDLGHTGADVYLRGMVHVQLEGVWGGHEDTAATLRGTCALALVQCPLDSFEILIRLTSLLNDEVVSVRVDAVRAMGQLAAREGVLPLRLKALLGDKEAEVTGWCFTALLDIAPRDSLHFVAGFLHHEDPDIRMEAVNSLAACREESAVKFLEQFWERQSNPEARKTFVQVLGGSPLQAAGELLLSIFADERGPIATEALKALAKSRFHGQMRDRIAASIHDRQDAELTRVFQTEFGEA